MSIVRRRVSAWFTPAHGRSRCLHCGMPWAADGDRIGHTLPYAARRSVFFTCEFCWPRTTCEQRKRYAERLFRGIWLDRGVPLQEIDDAHAAVQALIEAEELVRAA